MITAHNIIFQSSQSLSAAHTPSALANRTSAHGISGRLKALRRLKHGDVMRNLLLCLKNIIRGDMLMLLIRVKRMSTQYV